MCKGCINSYAKFGGAARRHFFSYLRKTDGGAHMCPPPAVRGVYTPIAPCGDEQHARFFRETLAHQGRNGGLYHHVPWKDAKWPVPARVKTARAS